MEMTVNVMLDASDKFLKAINMIGTAIVAARMDKLPWEEETSGETEGTVAETSGETEGTVAEKPKMAEPVVKETSGKAEGTVAKQPKTVAPVDELPFGDPEEESQTEAPSVAEPKTEEAETKAEEKPVAKAETTEKTYGKVEIRAAMQDVRNRIEYPDGGDEYDETLHKQLNAVFKAIAKRIEDGKKPTELVGDNAKAFIEACDGIILQDGKVCPF